MSKVIAYLTLCALGCFGCSTTEDLGRPPDVTFEASSYEGTAPLSVTFTVSVADDTGYSIKQYEWDFDGDGEVDETTKTAELEVEISHTYSEVAEYSPTVKVMYNEAEAWSRPPLNDSFSQLIVVTAPVE